MKVRNGFVSNSSSSSFICDVTGTVESGMDMCISDAEMYQCENGHTFLREYAVEFNDKDVYLKRMEQSLEYSIEHERSDVEEIRKIIEQIKDGTYEDFDELDYEYDLEMDYEYPAEGCPICQMKHIRDEDMLAYLLKKNGMTRYDVHKELEENFDFISMKKYIADNE